jgi:hypothetical protein
MNFKLFLLEENKKKEGYAIQLYNILIKDIIKFRVNFNKDHTGSLSVAFKNIK